MDRISALRNVEEALREFERGEVDLEGAERRVLAVLRMYATEFAETHEGLAAYRAAGDGRVEGTVVVAESPAAARKRVGELFDLDPGAAGVEVTPLDGGPGEP